MLRLIMIHDGNIDGLFAQVQVDVFGRYGVDIFISVDVRVYADMELIGLFFQSALSWFSST